MQNLTEQEDLLWAFLMSWNTFSFCSFSFVSQPNESPSFMMTITDVTLFLDRRTLSSRHSHALVLAAS